MGRDSCRIYMTQDGDVDPGGLFTTSASNPNCLLQIVSRLKIEGWRVK